MIKIISKGFDKVREAIAKERAKMQEDMERQLTSWGEAEVERFKAWIAAGGIVPPKVHPDGKPTGIKTGTYVDSLKVFYNRDRKQLTVYISDEWSRTTGYWLEHGSPGNNQVPRPHQGFLTYQLNNSAPTELKRFFDALLARAFGGS